MLIRPYKESDEQSWLRCRVLAFLQTAYFDNVLRSKELYRNPAIELVAVEHEQVIGLIDVECETEEDSICSPGQGLGGMIWHIAVHPDFQNKGIGKSLLLAAQAQAQERGLKRIEAWTRDDAWILDWYKKNGFIFKESYLHVFIEGKAEVAAAIYPELKKLTCQRAFAHCGIEHSDEIKAQFKRVHECNLLTKLL